MPYIGQAPQKGDENNFKILDDISSYTLTFDGSDASVVSAANDTITSNNHRFITGQRVTYTDGDGSAIAGLTDATVYFIIKEDHNTIKLATSASAATHNIAYLSCRRVSANVIGDEKTAAAIARVIFWVGSNRSLIGPEFISSWKVK